MASNGKKGSGNAAPTQNEQKKQTAEKKNDAVQHETEQQPVPIISVSREISQSFGCGKNY